MTNYELSAKSLYYVLERKKVDYLYHANTVATSITFIHNDALMSRKFVEEHGLGQTPQTSDEIPQGTGRPESKIAFRPAFFFRT